MMPSAARNPFGDVENKSLESTVTETKTAARRPCCDPPDDCCLPYDRPHDMSHHPVRRGDCL